MFARTAALTALVAGAFACKQPDATLNDPAPPGHASPRQTDARDDDRIDARADSDETDRSGAGEGTSITSGIDSDRAAPGTGGGSEAANRADAPTDRDERPATGTGGGGSADVE